MAGQIPTFTQRSWLSIVQEHEPDFYFLSQHPVVYEWSSGKHRTDGRGPYANNAVRQAVYTTDDGAAGFVTEGGDDTLITEVKG